MSIVVLACAGWAVQATAGNIKLSDSGWAVARPNVFDDQTRTADPFTPTATAPALKTLPDSLHKELANPFPVFSAPAAVPRVARSAGPDLRAARSDNTAQPVPQPADQAKQNDRPTDPPAPVDNNPGQPSDGDTAPPPQPEDRSPEPLIAEDNQPKEPTAQEPATPPEASGAKPDADAVVETQLPPPGRQLMSLRNNLRKVLQAYYRQTLNTRDHNPWEVMHGMIAYERRSRILQGGPRGKPITAIGWLCFNKPCNDQQLLYVTPAGEVRAKYGVGLEGHGGQFLAMLAQCDVPLEYPIRVGTNRFTVQDLVASEQKTCAPKTELTFKLIGLTHYLDLEASWQDEKGRQWDIPRLIREELAQPINGVACGGTHRLVGLSLAAKARQQRGEPLDGAYAEAAQRVREHQQLAFRLQNRDGSLSTQWFRGRGDEADIDRRVRTTGHQLEWLAYSLDDQELRDARMVRAVSYLTNLLASNYYNEWDIGIRSHALHALVLYDERVFQPYDQQKGVAVSFQNEPAPANVIRSRSSRH